MKESWFQKLKIDSFRVLLFMSLFSIMCFTFSNIENDDSLTIKIVFKEIDANTKLSSITERNIKYISCKNAFRPGNDLWKLASILYNRTDFESVQNTGGKYCTLFGNINQIIEASEPILSGGYLKHEELYEQVQWHNSLKITDFASYEKHLSSLQPEVLTSLEANPEFTVEKQYKMINELFEFYKKAHKNGSWILIHVDHSKNRY